MDVITANLDAIIKNLIKNFNTLLDCPVRFSGEYNEQKVHCFIEYIEYYKRIKCIDDEQALQELQHLLLDQAYDWWLRRKMNITTWSEAITILENQYSRRRPANVVYSQLLQNHYEDYESKDDFIDDKIELFSELSDPELNEKNKLEIMYALLPNDVQSKIKFINITSMKDLKEQLKLTKLDNDDIQYNTRNISNSNASTDVNIVLDIVQSSNLANNENCLEKNNGKSFVSSGKDDQASEKDSVIKVRRTEDLMPKDIKEEDEIPVLPKEFLSKDTECSATKNILNSSEDFQIDTDIMNQINNIIDESEMNMNISDNNQTASTILSQPSNCVGPLELLGFSIEPSKEPNKSSDAQSKSIKTSKKLKKRCTYCRRFNHTAQICMKRAKHMKLFPERFVQSMSGEDGNISQETINEEPIKTLKVSNSNCNLSTANTQATETSVTVPAFLNQTSTISTPLTDISPVINSSAVILINTTEKFINPILTTKLIAPINGKTPNKMLAAKLRSINTPSPKCHQCGTLGFYKSICPNCSPIYNNNHHQYSK